ncbi:hypothetical protein N8T08_007834 [Aspergillus melleus]|uniref:Uncharacterized protein n=1 Tax=Aspergillus melleus TaxID=138277 RepID=A0ACC3AXP2_9EURO|nr:hypothetical protein N8T08_007834 [Aspergillus melleus]
MNGIRSTQEKRFFDHFVNVTSRTLTLPSDWNSQTILSVIVSMCSEDTLVLKTVLCLGASHLINHLPSNAAEGRSLVTEKNRLLHESERELSSRVAALQNMSSLTTQNQTQYQPLLTSYLLLYLYEVSEGTGNVAWQTRLDEARGIVSSALKEHRDLSGMRHENPDGHEGVLKPSPEELDNLWIAEPLLQFFIYHDAIGSVTAPRPRRMVISHRHNDLSPPPHMLGVHNGIINFVARIAALRSDTGGEPSLSSAGITSAVCIWQDIGKWEPSESDSELSPDYCTMCELYIVACFIWLFFMLHPDSSNDEKVQSMVCRGLGSLSFIEEPKLQSFALFPVFVIGVACTRQEDREQIEEQLDILEQLRRFGG